MSRFDQLRGQAEDLLETGEHDAPDASQADLASVLLELQVHQVELELQNDELRRSEAELETAREHYVDLYELAPVGYLTVDHGDVIVECNLTLAKQLRIARGEILGKNLKSLCDGDSAAALELTRRGQRPPPAELNLRLDDGRVATFSLEIAADPGDGLRRCAVVDISHTRKLEQAVRFHADLVDQVSDAIIASDLDHRIVAWNRAAERMYGWTQAEAIGKNDVEMTGSELRARGSRDASRGRRETGGWTGERTHWTKGGRQLPVLVSDTLRRDSAGQPSGYVSVVRDLTDIRDREARLEAIVDTAGDGIVTIDASGIIEQANPAAERMFGWGPSELIGSPVAILTPDSHRGTRAADLTRYAATGEAMGKPGELTAIKKDGTEFAVEVAVTELRDHQHRFAAIIRDITERRAETESRRREQNLTEQLVESAPVVVIVLDPEGRLLRVNRFLEELCGRSRDELVGQFRFDVMSPEPERERVRQIHEDVVAGKWTATPISIPLRAASGSIRQIEWIHRNLLDDAGHVTAVLAIGQDITERAALEQQLRAQASLVHNVSDAVFSANFDYTVRSWNPAAERLFGWSAHEAVGSRWVDLAEFSPNTGGSADMMQSLRRSGTWAGDGDQRARDGTEIAVSMSANVARDGVGQPYVIYSVRDVRELRQLAAEFRQAQKMEALGRLASGISHDFNNLLMGVTGCADIALSKLPRTSAAAEFLHEIKTSAAGGAAIIRQLLAFSRRRDLDSAAIDVGAAVAGSFEMLRRLLGEDIHLEVSRSDPDAWIEGYDGQVEQILMNLVVNARDAMPGGGNLLLEISRQTVPPRWRSLPPGEYVVLRVSDTGCGMDEDTRQRLFEPFFTTKELGVGTGLGLSMVYGVVSQAGGQIRVDTKPGEGTTVTVYLPATKPPSFRQSTPVPDTSAQLTGKTALVVEDEYLVQLTCRHYLAEWGFTVLEAENADAALELVAEHGDDLDLILSDVVLPGVSGPRLIESIGRTCPSAAVIFMSAHSTEQLVRSGRLGPGQSALHKPFTAGQLREAVDLVLPAVLPVKPLSILLVEDDKRSRAPLEELLAVDGHRVLGAGTGEAALALARDRVATFDAMLLDARLPDIRGPRLAEQIRELLPNIAVIYVTGCDRDDPELADALAQPRTWYLAKPVAIERILAALRELV